MNIYLLVLVLYSAVLVCVGLFAARRVKTASDFLVAGRRFGPGVVFATFLAANIGAGSTVGASGLGYRYGLSAWWWVGSAGIGTFVLSTTVGPKLWQIAARHQLSTLGDYLEYRYSKAVKASTAVLLWCGTLSILAGQLMAIAWILNVVAGLDKWKGCLAGGLVAVLYCAAGGLASSAIVNIVELAVTMTGLLLSIPFALHGLGGWGAFAAQVAANAGAERARGLFHFTAVGARQIFAYLAILVPSFIVSPGLVQKLYGARSGAAVRQGVGLNAAAQLCFAVIPALFGMLAFARFPALPNPELALPSVMMRMVPPWLGLWALASVFSAELSASDAILFMLSTSLAVDLYKTFLNPEVQQAKLLAVSRLISVLAGAAGVTLAIVLPSVISAVSIFYGLLAVALFIPLLFGLYWRRMTTRAALAGIFAAAPATGILIYGTGGKGLWLLSPPAIGIGIAAAVAWAVTQTHSRAQPADESTLPAAGGT